MEISKSNKDTRCTFQAPCFANQFRKTTQGTALISSMPDKLM